MEALPIFLDMLMPSVVAILISVTLILAFGEIMPQAICTRYELSVGPWRHPLPGYCSSSSSPSPTRSVRYSLRQLILFLLLASTRIRVGLLLEPSEIGMGH